MPGAEQRHRHGLRQRRTGQRGEHRVGVELRIGGDALRPQAPEAVERLGKVAAELNSRPRKTLGWETPAERLANLLATAS
ncbi:hypothetical protein E1283_00840 [Streptomyces hainanensis]|uniref:IS30 family transposase n=1 Tax=Streptomyces hainanensis TaxID=402648 RepID=A0A4R4TPV9_9ACTN|nr:hypothetical protein E1283_00840 [Streptomyces hainanensis]